MRLELAQRRGARGAVTLVPLVDAMLILLIFFMVTSSYRNLDMLVLSKTETGPASPSAPTTPGAPLFLRLAADGQVVFRGRRGPAEATAAALAPALAARPGAGVVILPSPEAPTQALVAAMEAASRSGAASVRILQLEAQ